MPHKCEAIGTERVGRGKYVTGMTLKPISARRGDIAVATPPYVERNDLQRIATEPLAEKLE
jgi:hypothetical protein